MTAIDYEDDLRRRLKEARELIALHEGKKVGPYVVSAEIYADKWSEIAAAALQFVKRVEQGPEKFFSAGGNGAGGGHSWTCKSGDEIDLEHPVFRKNYD